MSTPQDLTQQVIERMKALKEYTVNVPVEDNWLPNGVVPFNIKIKNNIATVTLPALNEEEAINKAIAYFNSTEED